MEISPRKPCKRSSEPLDEWLQEEGFFRKHGPREPTCLFRAVSEQIYLTQHFHIRVRRECVEFMKRNKHLLEGNITISSESYLEQMACITEWGGPLEIQAMSLLYGREFVIFSGQSLTRCIVTDNGFDKMILLCHTMQKHYESVYPRDFISVAAYCQSLVYQTLYKNVFKMTNVDNTVDLMLHDKTSNFRHEKFFLKENVDNREQLALELFNKLEDCSEENEEIQAICKGITPFPYRVAKALDPNIYRNTDFDIWHEVKREVRNGGWTRYNSTELQVGGKCLVQMDLNEEELDKDNGNSVYIEKDNNGNPNERAILKTGRRDPLCYNGHIQEMSKNEGPVVVFIEELGEKRTVPYSALKPSSPRKTTNKQPGWGITTPKKNVLSDVNTKWWKKSWNLNSRKIKELPVNGDSQSNNNDDRNNNNHISNNKGNGEDATQWDNGSRNWEKGHSTMLFESYGIDRFTSYQGYQTENSVDAMPVTMSNTQPALVEQQQQQQKESNEGSEKTSKTDTNDNEKIVSGSSALIIANENGSQPSPVCNSHPQGETYYPPQSNIPPFFPGTPNMYYPPPDGNAYSQFHYVVGNSNDQLIPGNEMERVLTSINLSAPKSVDVNGSDLPFADMLTLRFFYNLGLEYFRAGNLWSCHPVPVPYGSYYVGPIGSTAMNMQTGNYNGGSISEESVNKITEGINQNCIITRRKDDYPENGGRVTNNGQALSKPGVPRSILQDFPMKNISQKTPPNKGYGNYDKVKEQNTPNRDAIRNNKNGSGSRFKKNLDGRYRNSYQQSPYQQQTQNQQQQQPQQQTPYQHSNGCVETPPPTQPGRNDLVQGQRSSPPQQAGHSFGNPSTYQSPYSTQQTMYAPVPYYSGESESYGHSYYTSNTGYYSVPYVSRSDVADGNNVNAYPPNAYSNVDNYPATSFCEVYPQYVYPQQNMYPGVPQQPPQENWYPVPGQGQYVQYAALPSPISGSSSSSISATPPNVSGDL